MIETQQPTPGPYRWVSEALDFVARRVSAETARGDNLRPLPEPLRKPPTQEGQE